MKKTWGKPELMTIHTKETEQGPGNTLYDMNLSAGTPVIPGQDITS